MLCGVMPDLLHECWEEGEAIAFGPVTEPSDRSRATFYPEARFLFSLRASSFNRAKQGYQERLGYGDYVPPEGLPDIVYTEEQFAVQEAYLRVREPPAGADEAGQKPE
jgi:hypothetical protein